MNGEPHTEAHTETYQETWNAESAVELETGGRDGEAARNLFIASATADEKLDEGTQPIPAEAQSIASFGQQGADAQVPATHPDNTKLPVNVSAPASYYTFEVGAPKHEVHIYANGIDLRTNTPTFCVGQSIALSAAISPSIGSTSAIVVAKWLLDGEYVNEITPPQYADGSPGYVVNQDYLTNFTTQAWWVDGEFSPGSLLAARFAVNLEFSGGKQIVVNDKGKFGMHRPRLVTSDSPNDRRLFAPAHWQLPKIRHC